MEEELLRFAEYLKNERRMAHNTLVSYERDLRQMIIWLNAQGITRPEKVTDTVLNSYVLWLEREGKATTTISRVVASTKAFFAYEAKKGVIPFNPAESLKAPKVEKKLPTVLTGAEVEAFLQQTQGRTLKKLRDRAMLELLCATGLRVSEIIDLIQTHDLPAIFVETNGPNATAQAIGEECGKTAPFTVGVLTLIMSRDPDNEGIAAYCAGLAKCADVIQEAYS